MIEPITLESFLNEDEIAFTYKLFDKERELIYVGSTISLKKRIRDHSKDKKWWPEVKYISYNNYLSIDEARTMETILIIAKNPKYNAVHNDSSPRWRLTGTSESIHKRSLEYKIICCFKLNPVLKVGDIVKLLDLEFTQENRYAIKIVINKMKRTGKIISLSEGKFHLL